MADSAGLSNADLARQRAEAAAASKIFAQQAAKTIETMLSDVATAREEAAEILADIKVQRRAVSDLRAQAQEDVRQAKLALQAAVELHATLLAGVIPYDDAETQLGAETVAAAIAAIADLARSAGGGQAGRLDFSDPKQSGLFPAL